MGPLGSRRGDRSEKVTPCPARRLSRERLYHIILLPSSGGGRDGGNTDSDNTGDCSHFLRGGSCGREHYRYVRCRPNYQDDHRYDDVSSQLVLPVLRFPVYLHRDSKAQARLTIAGDGTLRLRKRPA